MTGKNEIYVKVTKDGPYEVYGKPTIRKAAIEPNAEGVSWNYQTGEEVFCEKEPTALYRCDRSKGTPCCDGSHASVKYKAGVGTAYDNI